MLGRTAIVCAVLALGCGRLGFDPPNSATDGGADGPAGGSDGGSGDAHAATDLFVDPAGDDGNPGTADKPLQTLAEAANRVVPGSNVFIAAGTYDAFTLTRSGDDTGLIQFEGLGGGVVIQQGTGDAAAVMFQASYAQIHNVTLECTTVCFSANPGSSATPIEQVKTGNVTFSGGTTQLLATDAEGLFVFGSTFAGGLEAIRLTGASHFPYISDSRIDGAIVIAGQAGARLQSPKIERNTIGSIVDMLEVDSPELRSNVVFAARTVRIAESQGGALVNNTLVATDIALVVDSATPAVILFNNVLFATAAGIGLSVDAVAVVNSDRNAFVGTVRVNGGEVGFPGWQAAGQDGSSFASSDNLLFENLNEGMLMPPDGSPLVDSGLVTYDGVTAPEFDLFGGDRPVGEIDIGAWEQ